MGLNKYVHANISLSRNLTPLASVWVPHHKEITLFVVKFIIRQTGKPREEFY